MRISANLLAVNQRNLQLTMYIDHYINIVNIFVFLDVYVLSAGLFHSIKSKILFLGNSSVSRPSCILG